MVGRFAEARARVQADAVVGDAGLFKLGSALAQVLDDFGNNIVVMRFVLHGARVAALHVHNHQARIATLGNLYHGRVAEARNVVDDAGARLHGRLGNLGVAGVDAHADALAGQALDNAQHAALFLLDGNGACARARALAAHVDDKGALFHHLLRGLYRRIVIGIRPAIGKRVGGNVQDAHDNRGTGIEGVLATAPDHCSSYKRNPGLWARGIGAGWCFTRFYLLEPSLLAASSEGAAGSAGAAG